MVWTHTAASCKGSKNYEKFPRSECVYSNPLRANHHIPHFCWKIVTGIAIRCQKTIIKFTTWSNCSASGCITPLGQRLNSSSNSNASGEWFIPHVLRLRKHWADQRNGFPTFKMETRNFKRLLPSGRLGLNSSWMFQKNIEVGLTQASGLCDKLY